jgi:hypothetical protein
LLAVLMPGLQTAKALAKRLQCQTRLKAIGGAIAPYAENFDGLVPMMTGAPNTPSAGTFMRGHWNVSELKDGVQKWYALGCLYKAEFVADGRLFYCPAAPGWLEEYQSYNNPSPWGTKLDQQAPNIGAGNVWVCVKRGYTYWPSSRKRLTQAEYNAFTSRPAEQQQGFNLRYAVSYPAPAMKYADLDPSRAISWDASTHTVKGSGYNYNVAFGDSHVYMQRVPKDAAGKYLFWYQQDSGGDGCRVLPEEECNANGTANPANWLEVKMCVYVTHLFP